MLSPVVDEVAEEVNTAVAKCNIDENPALAERYNINVIPTLIVLENGKEVARSVKSRFFYCLFLRSVGICLEKKRKYDKLLKRRLQENDYD